VSAGNRRPVSTVSTRLLIALWWLEWDSHPLEQRVDGAFEGTQGQLEYGLEHQHRLNRVIAVVKAASTPVMMGGAMPRLMACPSRGSGSHVEPTPGCIVSSC